MADCCLLTDYQQNRAEHDSSLPSTVGFCSVDDKVYVTYTIDRCNHMRESAPITCWSVSRNGADHWYWKSI